MKNIVKILGSLLGAFLLTISTASAADTAKGGGLKLMQLSTIGQIEAVQGGDAVVMTCPKCKTVTYTQVKATAKGGGSAVETVSAHGCPGCGAKIETAGHGKGKETKVTHTCSHCGSTEAFCSVLKKRDLESK
jgi:predicted RNA-binding Zn-ribbon protein involved in translation (DUF1610 family)